MADYRTVWQGATGLQPPLPPPQKKRNSKTQIL